MSYSLIMPIVKLVAGILAAGLATKVAAIKSQGATETERWKWGLTREGVVIVSALWLALSFSTVLDVLNYYDAEQKAAANKAKEAENDEKSDKLRQLQEDIYGLASKSKSGIDTANKQIVKSAGILDGVVQGQVEAAGTANQTLDRLVETSDVVHRSSKPLRPLRFTLDIKYEHDRTSEDLRKYSDKVQQIVREINANPDDRRRDMDKCNWSYDPRAIFLDGDSLLTTGFPEAQTAQRLFMIGKIRITIRPTRQPKEVIAPNQVTLLGDATFRGPQSICPRNPMARAEPSPPNLRVIIDRDTGDITQRFFVESVNPEGSLFGVHSLYDLPNMWLELSLPAFAQATDKPRVGSFAYQNDTFITGGKFPESIILDPNRFSPPIDLASTRADSKPGVSLIYQLSQRDLDSAARFENRRRERFKKKA